VVFHADHNWGVEGYVQSSSEPERLITREDVCGRHWSLAGDALNLIYPSDSGFDTRSFRIFSFGRDKIVIGGFTYTREK